jgi:hypothetical protein
LAGDDESLTTLQWQSIKCLGAKPRASSEPQSGTAETTPSSMEGVPSTMPPGNVLNSIRNLFSLNGKVAVITGTGVFYLIKTHEGLIDCGH